MKKITIVDYGSGNVLSAQKSFIKIAKDNNIDANVLISKKLNDVKNSTHIVLPGQGAFSTCMNGLKKTDGLIDEICEFALIKKKPFLGICVGMQMLAKMSEERGANEGLGWIDGKIKKLSVDDLKLPHMGWNMVLPTNSKYNKLISTKDDYYFVHSYYFDCADRDNILAETKYGINFASIVGKENIYGVQFHPEKSSSQGLNFIKNFLN